MRYYFRSVNLIGDALNISPAWRQWIKENCHWNNNGPNDEIYMQTLPDHTAPLYQGMVRDLVKIQTVFEKPEGEFDFQHTFNVNDAFALCDKNKCHIADAYAELLGVKLTGANDRLKPTYIPETFAISGDIGDIIDPEFKDNILISMFSASCTSRDPKIGIPNKCVPYIKWKPMFAYLRDRFPDTPIRILGAPTDRVPEEFESQLGIKQGEYMLGIPLNRLSLIMKSAKLLVSVDNGMGHLGASQETPTFLMYPSCLGVHYILPAGNPNLEYVQMNPVYVNPAQLLFGLKKAIERFKL
jgi:ADP-heptose:LPS heptosyltransferase